MTRNTNEKGGGGLATHSLHCFPTNRKIGRARHLELLRGTDAAGRDIDDVHLADKPLGQLGATLDRPALVALVLEVIGGTDPDEKGHTLRYDASRDVDNLLGQPDPVLEAPSVAIRTLVRDRTHKLVE